jgi:transposase
MQELKGYCNSLIENKQVEPNSSLGKAVAYLNNHWEEFTLFLRVPGVPLTNNEGEQLIKRAVLNRKNAYFFRNDTGAKIADILMSMIETCVYNGVNPWNYLVAVQTYERDVRANPRLWLPWVYENRLKEIQPR